MNIFNLKLSVKQLGLAVISFAMAGITLFVVYLAATRQNISLSNPEGKPGAISASCALNLSLYRPTPSPTPVPVCNSSCTSNSQCMSGMSCYITSQTGAGNCRNPSCLTDTDCVCATPSPTPTKSPKPSPTPSDYCRVSFDLPDQAVCWPTPINSFPVTYTVYSLPTVGGPFFMQTDWYIAAPYEGAHHYTAEQVITAGNTYTVYPDWPGIINNNQTTEIHVGLNVMKYNADRTNKELLSPHCSGGIDYYWTPYVVCGTPKPTATPYCSPWKKLWGGCKS